MGLPVALSIAIVEPIGGIMTLLPLPCEVTKNETGRRTILLVEDEPFVREATLKILESAGFVVFPVEDADEAARLYEARGRTIDLVMTDLILHGRTGAQLGRELRERSPEVKVLITSGYSNAELTTEDPAGHTYFLAKPYSRRSLIEKVEKILSLIPLHRAVTQAG
jgi:two-component system, cell cycle sensor histidine kinase and response regulator CckA